MSGSDGGKDIIVWRGGRKAIVGGRREGGERERGERREREGGERGMVRGDVGIIKGKRKKEKIVHHNSNAYM